MSVKLQMTHLTLITPGRHSFLIFSSVPFYSTALQCKVRVLTEKTIGIVTSLTPGRLTQAISSANVQSAPFNEEMHKYAEETGPLMQKISRNEEAQGSNYTPCSCKETSEF